MIKRFFRVLFDVFPIFDRPMAVCAVISSVAVIVLFYNKTQSLSLIVLFLILAIIIGALIRSKKLIIVMALFLAVCASTVDDLQLIDHLQSMSGQTVTADFLAIEDSVGTGKVTKVTAYCYNSTRFLKTQSILCTIFSVIKFIAVTDLRQR